MDAGYQTRCMKQRERGWRLGCERGRICSFSCHVEGVKVLVFKGAVARWEGRGGGC